MISYLILYSSYGNVLSCIIDNLVKNRLECSSKELKSINFKFYINIIIVIFNEI